MQTPKIVTEPEWEAARQQLLVQEKELTRARDALAAERRRMPWLAVEKDYQFDGPQGRVSLPDLFEGRRQLIVYRAFFEPGVYGWPDHACPGCSLVADQVAHLAHLNARDTTLAFASHAPQPEIARVQERMGWSIPWYTMTDQFDADHGVDEWHGTNAFIRQDGQVFRTYFVNNRGDETMGSTWSYLDLTALGRQEEWEDSPEGYPQTPPYQWWRWHDAYGDAENALVVLACLLSLGASLEEAATALAECAAPPGRMEMIESEARGKPLAVIDYAHTPDALAKALAALREHCRGALWCVFGCGGDRDPGKRPLMGAIADELADQIIVTDDNPRSENPEEIIRGITSAIKSHGVRVIHDRGEAIAAALNEAAAADVVLIAGKGHEDYQIYGSTRRCFSDRVEAMRHLGAAA